MKLQRYISLEYVFQKSLVMLTLMMVVVGIFCAWSSMKDLIVIGYDKKKAIWKGRGIYEKVQ